MKIPYNPIIIFYFYFHSPMDSQEEKLLSIMDFLMNYHPNVSMNTLLSAQSFYKLILSLDESTFNFNCEIQEGVTNWPLRLNNFEILLDKMEQYFEVVHHKCLETSKINLIDLCKKQSIEELIRCFELVMCLLMESPNKEKHIQHIMEMKESFQEHFVEIIQNSMNPAIFSERKYQRNVLRNVIAQFQEEKVDIERELNRLCQANLDLINRNLEQKAIIEELKNQIEEKNSDVAYTSEDLAKMNYFEDYNEKLKERIKSLSKEFEEERLGLNNRIKELEEKVSREEEIDEMNSFYKEKYEEIMDQMQKMNIWKKEKAKLEKTMDEKNFAIQKLHEKIEELSDRNLNLEEKELDFNLQIQKKNMRIKKLSEDLKKAIGGISHYNHEGWPSLDQSISFKQNVSLAEQEDEVNKIKKSNEKLLKENKQQQKQINKLSKKCEKLRMIEQEKKRLELLVYELRTIQSEELNLLVSVFYEGYQDSVEMMKSFKGYALDFSNQLSLKGRNMSKLEQIVEESFESRKYSPSKFGYGDQGSIQKIMINFQNE